MSLKASINHLSGHKSGVAGVYNRATYGKEKSGPLSKLGPIMSMIVAAGKP